MSEYTSNALYVPNIFTSASEGMSIVMGSLSNMTIRATPEEMEVKAQEVLKEVSTMMREYEDMNRLVERTSGYWNGEAAELHRKRFREMQDEVQTMFQCLNDHAKNLEQIAAVYTGTQIKVTSVASSLPTTAIE